MQRLLLVQLPVPPPAALAPTGNVPLAAGCLGVSARVHGLAGKLDIEVLAPSYTDVLGDALLAGHIAAREPDYVGFSLYLWNVERSLHLAREVKRRSPRTRVLVGGPEVSADNPFVLQQRGFDLAVSGEAEQSFAKLMHTLVDGGDPAGQAGVAVRRPLGLSPFGPACGADFPLTDYPSPYLTDLLAVDPRRSTYVETVRGCKSHCTFCFYPRSSSVLRALDVGQSAALVGGLRERGAREIVFLDPTFNHRPGFDELLDALALANPDRSVTMFAEVRAEGLTPEHARKLKRAGFDRLEIGLQSVNRDTLKRVKRGGSPDKVAAAARMLHEHGIELLVDLIVGLPGDDAQDVADGVDFLLENGLAGEAQVFPLSLLPGTAMRTTAAADGVVFDPAPPYRVEQTATMDADTVRETLFTAEERLGRRLDEQPRPHLVEQSRDAAPDVFRLDLDGAQADDYDRAARPGAQHAALWLCGRDLFARRAGLDRALAARLARDPYATLDVVLRPLGPFPLDLIDHLRARLDAAAPAYLSRSLAHRGENAMRRLVVVLPRELVVEPDYLAALRALVRVFRDQPLSAALREAEALGGAAACARIIDGCEDAAALAELARRADPDAVVFADRAQEAAWQAGPLGLG